MSEQARVWMARAWLAGVIIAAIASSLRLGGLEDVWTIYSTRSGWGQVGFVLGGLLPVVAGVAWHSLRPHGPVAALVALLGLAWLAPLWIGPIDTPPVVVTIARLVPFLLAPAALHLAAIFPTGQITPRGRRIVVAGWVVAVVPGVVRVLVLDPFYLDDCSENCWPGSNLLMISGNATLAQWLSTVRDVVPACLMVGAIVVAFRRRHEPARALWLPTVVALLAVLACAAWRGFAHLVGPELPSEARSWAPFAAEAGALACVSVSVCAVAVVLGIRRARAERIVAELTGEQLPVQGILSRRLDDEGVAVAYWLTGKGHFVDASGTRIGEPGGRRTTLQRNGQTVAVIGQRSTSQPVDELLGPASLLALDNERMRAEVLAQLVDLRESRARIVAASDESRLALERDLHDGAQQTMLALTYELRLAGLDEAVAEATAALADLRDLAHGIYPAVLEEGGLGLALEDLAETSEVPLRLAVGSVDIPPNIQTGVYAIVRSVVDGASGPLSLAIHEQAGQLVVRIEGSIEPDQGHVMDRIGALGGTGLVHPTVLEAVIPCG